MGLYLFWVHAEGSLGASYPNTNDPRRLSGLEESLNKQGSSVEEVRKMAKGSRVRARRRVGENEGEGPIYRQKNRAWCKGASSAQLWPMQSWIMENIRPVHLCLLN